jgi:hypothetical protein
MELGFQDLRDLSLADVEEVGGGGGPAVGDGAGRRLTHGQQVGRGRRGGMLTGRRKRGRAAE